LLLDYIAELAEPYQEEMTLVNAEPALKGFEAIIANERFNYYLFYQNMLLHKK
jgi:hypothetical protein